MMGLLDAWRRIQVLDELARLRGRDEVVWQRACKLAHTLPLSPSECYLRLVAGDTEQDVLDDVAAGCAMGYSAGWTPPWVYQRRRARLGEGET